MRVNYSGNDAAIHSEAIASSDAQKGISQSSSKPNGTWTGDIHSLRFRDNKRSIRELGRTTKATSTTHKHHAVLSGPCYLACIHTPYSQTNTLGDDHDT